MYGEDLAHLLEAAGDRPQKRWEQSKPGGAKPGHEAHSHVASDGPDSVIDHRQNRCVCCGGDLHGDLLAEIMSVSERIDPPELLPEVTQHRRLTVCCSPYCGLMWAERGARDYQLDSAVRFQVFAATQA